MLVAAERLVTVPGLADKRLWPAVTTPWPAGLCIRIKRTVCGRTMVEDAATDDTGSRIIVPAGDPGAAAARNTGVPGRTVAMLGRTVAGAPAVHAQK